MLSMFTGALRAYQKFNNNELPNRVFFYRDGVGDGQMKQVLDHEAEDIKKICAQYNIKLSFVVVNKRINTKFFTHGRQLDNPPPGTVVDSGVTLPERYDFYLISQSVKQGTVNPTSYNILFDNSGFPPDRHQKLAYKLTHLYFNWSGTVRVPAPVQYAHKLAFLVGDSLHAKPAEDLCYNLFFL